jgi:hypothetical protein
MGTRGAMKGTPFIYEIKVEGLVDSLWTEWFHDMKITYINGTETVLQGELQDQAALHGVLEKIRDLSIPLISVRRIDGNQ